MATSKLHATARKMKEDLVAERGVEDLAPFMLATSDDGETFYGKPGAGMIDALESGVRIGAILHDSVMTLRQEHDGVPIRRLMLVIEGYSRSIQPGQEDRMPKEHGDLARDYVDNPASDVVEVLMTSVWIYNGIDIDYQLWLSPFRYVEGGGLEWGETLGPTATEESTGAVCDAGKKAMR